jgi:hypothetical protein
MVSDRSDFPVIPLMFSGVTWRFSRGAPVLWDPWWRPGLHNRYSKKKEPVARSASGRWLAAREPNK